ncbi:anthranilate phosphoribosyltransferase [Paraglaciecola sp. MB-3u-78]|jgi:anthranilate phosphoribosyltransferase|uniref:anthranilate phosphoribosyltransferase n=1 Tax=Paraglaciecola sp. MB-3u-78 TaxID=2058332 RepID=UPI000C33D9D7|nr:anthranilate phosphoribosyltransferase [Paraglaciecola sp. MB-3u-78]PKG97132.1 anthranilate phosphoribosyltransferase [Paraglaciecola sp. MB-3u-78]
MIHTILQQLYQGQDLKQDDVTEVFSQVVTGQVDDIILSSLLTALKIKGEQPEEIAGAANALIANAGFFPRPDYEFADIVGTGGDGHNTINISSASAIVAASCGVKVAKHGNRSVSSQSGSADLFKAFDLELGMSAYTARQCLDESNLCFLFAPNYHSGIRHAMPVRTTLKTRTLFNLLGPLVNPARPSHIIIGVYAPELLMPFAKTLQLLGYQKALVVHGSGLDEFALHGNTQVVEVNGDKLTQSSVSPADFGLENYPLDAIKGGEPAENKILIENVLLGKGEAAHQTAVAMNTAALLKLCGKVETYAQGAEMAIKAMQQQRPLATIKLSASISQNQ